MACSIQTTHAIVYYYQQLHAKLADRCEQLKKDGEITKTAKAIEARGGTLSEDLLYHLDLHGDSDSEGEDSDDEDEGIVEQRRLRRKFRERKPKTLKGLFWSSHQRFFRSLCIASKVDKAIEIAKKAVNEDGHCCVIGLQSTGEARSKGAAKSSGINLDKASGALDDFVSAPNEDLKRISEYNFDFAVIMCNININIFDLLIDFTPFPSTLQPHYSHANHVPPTSQAKGCHRTPVFERSEE